MDFRLPELGEGVYEAEVVSWLVKPGDPVKRGQNVLEVMTDKAAMEVPSPFTGTITGLQAEPGKLIKVGEVILTYEPASKHDAAPTEPEPPREPEPPQRRPAPAAPTALGNGPPVAERRLELPVKAAPSVRYLAQKLGIDLHGVRGTGPEGRVLVGDLAPHVAAPAAGAKPAVPEVRPDYGKAGTRVKLLGLRRKIAEHMVLAKRTAPHYTYVDECDVTELVRLRPSVREVYAPTGVKITYLAFFIKAVTAALKEIPLVNASLDEAAGEIVLHDRYHIGIAVATPGGLIVPVIHDADRKDVAQIAREAERLSEAARTGKVKLEDLRGGTFTVTSIGGIGGLISTPVINHPEVAILGIGKVVKRPVYDEAGNLKPADLVYLSLSFDHRVVDGAVGAAFANAVIRRLQNPVALLLPEKLL
jgi:pyruvate dehydrogenase E2 component (dihydrolipoamide acetyltransferase)/2-oxoisovalerate dehydrogenase E2 component (dihydrolipoyl transacylase)